MKKANIFTWGRFCLSFMVCAAVVSGLTVTAFADVPPVPEDANELHFQLTDNDYTVISPKDMRERFIEKTNFLAAPEYEQYMSRLAFTFSPLNGLDEWEKLGGTEETMRAMTRYERFCRNVLYFHPKNDIFGNNGVSKSAFRMFNGDNWEDMLSKRVNFENVLDEDGQKIVDAVYEVADRHRNNHENYGRFIDPYDETPVFGQAGIPIERGRTNTADSQTESGETGISETAVPVASDETGTLTDVGAAVSENEDTKENIFMKRTDIIAVAVVVAAGAAFIIIKKLKKKDW